MTNHKILFLPGNVEISVPHGINLIDAAIDAGIHVNVSCGGEGICGKCRITIEEGQVQGGISKKLSHTDLKNNIRLACKSRVICNVVVNVPVEAGDRSSKLGISYDHRYTARIKQLNLDNLKEGGFFIPTVEKIFFQMPKPDELNRLPDATRIIEYFKTHLDKRDLQVGLPVMRKIPDIVRRTEFCITGTLIKPIKTSNKPQLLNVQPGDTTDENLAIVVDVGTTTICGELIDLQTGNILCEHGSINGQISYGEDVISRIIFAEKQGGLEKMNKVLLDTINSVISEVIERSNSNIDNVSVIAFAGNTTMTQLLLKINPRYIRIAPYIPASTFYPPVPSIELGISLNDHSIALIYPTISSYVGGDIVAGIISSGMYDSNKLSLFIDIGTNAEIVIGNQDWMMCAACSAGPTFEGGGIEFGTRAISGAIEDFSINATNFEPNLVTIGNVRPKGICGSGLIAIVAVMLETGVINGTGKFDRDLPTNRIRRKRGIYEYVLSWSIENQIDRDIVITEADIDNCIRSKGAIFSGCISMLDEVGVGVRDIEQIIIAGGFGSYIDLEKAITIGLLPEVDFNKVIFVGNSSLTGLKMGLLSNSMRENILGLTKKITSCELSEVKSYMDNYMASLFLPHTNMELFPKLDRRLSSNKNKNP